MVMILYFVVVDMIHCGFRTPPHHVRSTTSTLKSDIIEAWKIRKKKNNRKEAWKHHKKKKAEAEFRPAKAGPTPAKAGHTPAKAGPDMPTLFWP
jgi:hypothetical protein